jgi:predicted acylesterase/phospholipase RssA
MTDIRLKFVFQGGGAKLVHLLAAAHAVHEQSKNLGFAIAAVSGASAGAIAAAVLGLGIDPAVFRANLRRLAKEDFDQIIKPIGRTSYGWAIAGYTLYDDKAYRKFLRELFARPDGAIPHLKHKVTDVFISATDIRNGTCKVYDGEQEEDTVEDALFSSSAIPVVFRNFSEKNYFLDGGLVDNFPSDRLVGESSGDDVFGFAFRRNESYDFKNLKEYLAAIVFSAMDYSVERSLARLPEGNIHYIPTKIKTLDFAPALTLLDNDIQYEKEKLAIENVLKGFIEKKRLQMAQAEADARLAVASELEARQQHQQMIAELQNKIVVETSNAQRLIDKFRILHKAQHAANSFTVKKRAYIHKCNALKARRTDVPDDVQGVDQLILHQDLAGYGISIKSGENLIDAGEIAFQIADSRKNDYPAISVNLLPKYASRDQEDSNIMLFLLRPLPRSSTEVYTIGFSATNEQVLYDLITDKKSDSILYVNELSDLVEELNLVCLVPADCFPDLVDLPSSERPPDFEWIVGTEMVAADFASLPFFPPSGFRPIGWKAARLKRGAAAGFMALAHSKPFTRA